jgi:hypothetical protein
MTSCVFLHGSDVNEDEAIISRNPTLCMLATCPRPDTPFSYLGAGTGLGIGRIVCIRPTTSIPAARVLVF